MVQSVKNQMRLSDAGLAKIEEREGLGDGKPKTRELYDPYLDIAGIPTIGFGCTYYPIAWKGTMRRRPVTMEDPGLTFAEAEDLLLLVLVEFLEEVNRLVLVPLTQNQFDALISLVYNIGIKNFTLSTLRAMLNLRQYGKAAEQFAVWDKVTINGRKKVSQGLVNRRRDEMLQFLTAPKGDQNVQAVS